jgi:hypothetical protein
VSAAHGIDETLAHGLNADSMWIFGLAIPVSSP